MEFIKMREYIAAHEAIDCSCSCHLIGDNCVTGSPCCVLWGQIRPGDPELVREMKAALNEEQIGWAWPNKDGQLKAAIPWYFMVMDEPVPERPGITPVYRKVDK